MAKVAPYALIVACSIEGMLFGINCVLYAFCVYMLSGSGRKSVSSRVLLLINTVQFLLCATQTILHMILYFNVFTVYNGSILPYLQHVNIYILGSAVIFNITFISTGFLSIWRLYVLYENEARVCIPAFVVWIAQICASAMAIRVCVTRRIALTGFDRFHMLLWGLITALNLYVAIPICIRLCIAQKRNHTVLSASPYKSIAIVLVECGAMITAGSVAMTILYACNYIDAFLSLGIATELAITSQLLVTARHGMLSQGRPTCSPPSTTLGINVTGNETGDQSTKFTINNTLGSFVESTSQDRKDRLDAS